MTPKVHMLRTWLFAHCEARKGKWEEVGRDNERFKHRIIQQAPDIEPVLCPKHRAKIYLERFRDDFELLL